MGSEPWLEGWIGPDAGFIVRHELGLEALGEGAFWVQALLVLGLFPLGLLASGGAGAAVGVALSRRAAESVQALVLSLAGLGLAVLAPAVMAWAALVTLQDAAMDVDRVVGVGFLAVLLVTAGPLGALSRGKRIHGKAPWMTLVVPLVFPVVAGAQYVRILAAPDAAGAGLTRFVYDGLVMAAGLEPAWLALVASGGITLFAGTVLSPLSLQGVFDVLVALKDKGTG